MTNQITPTFMLEDGSVVPMEQMEPQASHGGPAVPAPKTKIIKDTAGGVTLFPLKFILEKINFPDTLRILAATPPATAGLTIEDHHFHFGYFEVQDLSP